MIHTHCPLLHQVDWTVSGLGGHVYAMSVKAHESSRRLAIGCGDSTIRLAPLLGDAAASQPQDSSLIWQVSSCANSIPFVVI